MIWNEIILKLNNIKIKWNDFENYFTFQGQREGFDANVGDSDGFHFLLWSVYISINYKSQNLNSIIKSTSFTVNGIAEKYFSLSQRPQKNFKYFSSYYEDS